MTQASIGLNFTQSFFHVFSWSLNWDLASSALGTTPWGFKKFYSWNLKKWPGCQLDLTLLTATLWVWLSSQCFIWQGVRSSKLWPASFLMRIPWEWVSNALWKSRQIIPTAFTSPIRWVILWHKGMCYFLGICSHHVKKDEEQNSYPWIPRALGNKAGTFCPAWGAHFPSPQAVWVIFISLFIDLSTSKAVRCFPFYPNYGVGLQLPDFLLHSQVEVHKCKQIDFVE